ncbi:glutathione synthase [Chryseobacterium sp. 18068]|uniref:glutathione synthase n=1 Tax=Chryseobacterium sp. 18068 TaxID=2681414 RepID=UPI00135692A9|nr:glutathione synthase [Chryseobacterium sp. 18068]
MASINFSKQNFVKDGDRYKLGFKKNDIGEGVDLIVERKEENGTFTLIQAEINRANDNVFVVWSEPFDGRVVTDEYKQL